MGSVSHEDAVRGVHALKTLHNSTADFLNEYGHEPAAESQAAIELEEFQQPTFVQTAYSQGGVLLEATADQLMTVVEALSEPVQTIAPWSSSRAVLETSALASWLLDTEIGAKERVRRSFAFRFEGLTQQKKLVRIAGTADDLAKNKQRIDKVEQDALNLGFGRVENRKGRRIGIGQQMPSTTDLIADMLDEEITFRLASAITHAHPFALQQVSFRKVGDPENDDLNFIEKSLKPVVVIYLCGKTAKAFASAVQVRFKLLGLYSEQLDEAIHSSLQEIGIDQSQKESG